LENQKSRHQQNLKLAMMQRTRKQMMPQEKQHEREPRSRKSRGIKHEIFEKQEVYRSNNIDAHTHTIYLCQNPRPMHPLKAVARERTAAGGMIAA
jgi:hypothetical protein